MKSGYVYILQDKKGKFYIGSTDNMERRLYQHARGHTRSTRVMIDSQVMLVQQCASLLTARKIERWLKKLKRKDYIEKIVKDGYIKMKI